MRSQEFTEVKLLTVQKKGRNLDNLPRRGKPIPAGREEDYLGRKIGRLPGGLQVWRYNEGTISSFALFDPETRRSTLIVSGTRYPQNPSSLIVYGVYAAPGNPIRASEFYHYLITELGLTLISDRLQSEGGYRVWQELERRYPQSVTVYGFDTKTDEPLNISTRDTGDTHVTHRELDQAPPGMRHELARKAKNIRLVATRK